MTPKEKAEELFQFYLPFVSSIGTLDDIKYRCKQCALISINLILKEHPMANDYFYWVEVGEEIEAL